MTTALLPATGACSPTLAEKVAHLSRPESYLDDTTAVEVIETHMSYVFLTDTHVYKLKKPVRYPFLDFTSLEARRLNCEDEVRLNRRLARNVYLGVMRLVRAEAGLRVQAEGEPVEWLVKMRRLPRHLMLDQAIRERRVAEADVVRFTRVLASFYRSAERVALTPAAYRANLRGAIIDDLRGLAMPDYGFSGALLDTIGSALLAFLDDHVAVLDERVERALLVEGHGDLRPEHVCLAAEPVFIDCLEFSRDLRIVDPADELGYLAMEAEFTGAGDIGEVIFETYTACTGDRPPPALVRFHQSRRAVLRAKLSAWHLEDHLTESSRAKWLARGQAYLHRARDYCAAP